MRKERMKILDLVEKEKISVEEAVKLMQNVQSQSSFADVKEGVSEKFEGLKDEIVNVSKEVTPKIKETAKTVFDKSGEAISKLGASLKGIIKSKKEENSTEQSFSDDNTVTTEEFELSVRKEDKPIILFDKKNTKEKAMELEAKKIEAIESKDTNKE